LNGGALRQGPGPSCPLHSRLRRSRVVGVPVYDRQNLVRPALSTSRPALAMPALIRSLAARQKVRCEF